MSTVNQSPVLATETDAAAAGWREVYESLTGAHAAGPDQAQRVHVLKIGPEDASKVVVLLGGREGAANVLRLVGRDLANKVSDVQVWAVDPREQQFADLSGFELHPQAARDYYLGGRYREQGTAPYAGQWGLSVLVGDLREVVLAASQGDRRQVVLGGHSVGGTAALCYAAWDFDGYPGYRDLAGLLLLDGGVHDAFKGAGMEFALTVDAVKGWLDQIEGGALFEDATSTGAQLGEKPETAAIWFQLAAKHAFADPHGPCALATQAPAFYATDRPLTNAGFFGRLVDARLPHPGFRVNSGRLLDDGDWVDDGPTPLARVAEAFAGPRPGAWVWYTLNRLMLDYVAALNFADDEVSRLLGLRLLHAREIDVPLYAIQSGFTGGTVGRAAERVVAESKITEFSLHTSAKLSHMDIVYAAPEANGFLRTVGEFLITLPARKEES